MWTRVLQLYGFQSAVKLSNSILNINSAILRRGVQADLNLQPRPSACWTAQLQITFKYCMDVSQVYELFKLGGVCANFES
jgi:hypothetical protein